ncbi:MAG: type II toxin-antitoxin system RelE/ParE family toxin [Pseudohongiella sp.]|nr:type II toxin-antitoxin system RelE/ParE family toxin [Pseudohongiella sp.]MDP2128507.1 type II toxin-antitoxin system RelE/ParE family toxin [Pseudohongiella sp.]
MAILSFKHINSFYKSVSIVRQSDILRYFRERIATDEDPRRFGKPLAGELTGLWRYRVRKYRMICNIEDKKLVVRVSHRKDV